MFALALVVVVVVGGAVPVVGVGVGVGVVAGGGVVVALKLMPYAIIPLYKTHRGDYAALSANFCVFVCLALAVAVPNSSFPIPISLSDPSQFANPYTNA